MIAFILKVIGGLVALIGPFVGIAYYIRIAYRQEKSILILFIQDFILLFKRSTLYYEQMLSGAQSYSTLFHISDSSLYGKLADVVKDPNTIEKMLELEAKFFQVIRYADRASETIAKSIIADDENTEKHYQLAARKFQGLAIVFFIGDLIPDKNIYRNGIDGLVDKLAYILDYLEIVNSKVAFLNGLMKIFPQLYAEVNATTSLIKTRRSDLTQLREKLYVLREKERLLIEKKNLLSDDQKK